MDCRCSYFNCNDWVNTTIYMIPEFPKFKKLELTDRAEVEKITSQFPQYSDFNFTSLLIWNLSGDNAVSRLKGNLIIRIKDYITGDMLLSIVGVGEIEDSIDAVFQHTQDNQGLDLVPEVVVDAMDETRFVISEQTHHNDYVYSLQDIVGFHGSKYKSKRKALKKFVDSFGPNVSYIDFTKKNNTHRAIQVFQHWGQHNLGSIEQDNEILALENFFKVASVQPSRFVGFFVQINVGDESIGLSIAEKIIGTEYCVLHFEKGVTREYPNIGPYLFNTMAKHMYNEGYRFINLEQDLGIPGLRINKLSYKPTNMLRKFHISK